MNKKIDDFIYYLAFATIFGASLKAVLTKEKDMRIIIKNIIAGLIGGSIVILFYYVGDIKPIVALGLAVLISTSITALYPIVETWWLRFVKKYLKTDITKDAIDNNL